MEEGFFSFYEKYLLPALGILISGNICRNCATSVSFFFVIFELYFNRNQKAYSELKYFFDYFLPLYFSDPVALTVTGRTSFYRFDTETDNGGET